MNKTLSYKWASIILITMIGTFFFVEISSAAVPEGHDFTSIPVGADYAPGELLVRFAPKGSGAVRSTEEKNEILSSLGGATIKRNYTIVPGLSLVELPTGVTVKDALKTFNKTDGILHAEPNYRVKALSTFPNDSYFTKQWHLHNTGQTGGTEDADIDAPEAWENSTTKARRQPGPRWGSRAGAGGPNSRSWDFSQSLLTSGAGGV